MATTVFDVLIGRVDEQLESTKEFLTKGGPKDYAAFREVVGLIRGLETSKVFIEDLSRNYMEDGDEY